MPPNPSGVLFVYLEHDISGSQKQAVEAKIRALPGAVDISFTTREESSAMHDQLVKDNPAVPARDKSAGDLSASFTVRLTDLATVEAAAAALNETVGVSKVGVAPK
jgi:cell division protein FtsX